MVRQGYECFPFAIKVKRLNSVSSEMKAIYFVHSFYLFGLLSLYSERTAVFDVHISTVSGLPCLLVHIPSQ